VRVCDFRARSYSFKRSLLNKCEDEFNKQDIYVDWKTDNKAYQESKSTKDAAERKEKEEDLHFRRIKIKKQMLGNIKFIGQLYKKGLLKEKIMRFCVASLLKLETKDSRSKLPVYYDTGDTDMDEEDHEAICNMFATIGSTIDRAPAATFMHVCFIKINKLSDDPVLPSRSRFMYKDLIELRNNNWVPRRKEEKAKTLEEIRKDVEREERQQQQISQQNAGNYRGGGRNDYNNRGRDSRGGGGDYNNNNNNNSRPSFGGGNRSRQSKPVVQTDDDGFTTIVGASSGTTNMNVKSSLAQAALAPKASRPQTVKTKRTVKKDAPVAPANDPAPPAASKSNSAHEPMTKEKFERRVKSIRSEFKQDPSNIDELLLSVDELSGTPDYGSQFVSMNSDHIIDCKEDERKSIFSMLALLVEKGKITSSDVKAGLMDLIEFIDSFVCDAPKAFDYLGEMLSTMLRVKAVDVSYVCEHAEKTKPSSEANPEKIIRAFAGAIEASQGKDALRASFSGSAKALESLLGSDKWAAISKDIL
jgi:hypothetical protein